MPESEFVRTLLVYGVAAAKGNDKHEARSHLNRVLYQTDASEEQKIEAWWWLSQIAEKPDEKRQLLQNILQVNPTEPRARRDMAMLQGKLNQKDVLGPHTRTVIQLRRPADSPPTALFVRSVEGGFPIWSHKGKSVATTVVPRFEIHSLPQSLQPLRSKIFTLTFPRRAPAAGNCRRNDT